MLTAIASSLPKLGYPTFFDALVFVCYSTIFLSLVQEMAARVLDRNGHALAAARLDTVSRCFFPLGFVVAVYQFR